MLIIKAKTFFISVLVAFCLISIFLNAALFYEIVKEQQIYKEHQANAKVLAFRNMFTEKVLLADKEIDFDTRLALETSVRNLNDSEIFSEWQDFTNSSTKEIATANAKKLLELLIQKTSS